ncbi:MAG: hypothetical protein ACRDNZ_20680 [Streptosporangiaceae bacterium]
MKALSARLTAAKATPERAWLAEVSSVALQQALADLNTAYRNFFASVTGERTGPHVAPLRLRSRKDRRQSIRFTRNARFTITAGGALRLPKIGDLRKARRRNPAPSGQGAAGWLTGEDVIPSLAGDDPALLGTPDHQLAQRPVLSGDAD